MAGSRRSSSRQLASRAATCDLRAKNAAAERSGEWRAPAARLPHVLLPPLCVLDELRFELLMAVFVSCCLAAQYLNLYHTVWWLHYLHVNHVMKYYLIDTDVVLFIMLFLNRRLVWSLVKTLTLKLAPNKFLFYSYITARCAVLAFFGFALSWLTYRISLKHDPFRLFYLHYLLLVHLVVLGGGADSFLSLLPDYGAEYRPVFHSCSVDAEFVRQEMNHLKIDFNMRVKQTLYNAIAVGYYTGLAPMFFAQSVLHYEWRFAASHAVFVLLASAALLWCYCVPSRYCDVLHQCALHLGNWTQLTERRHQLAFNAWSRCQLWTKGVLVKHCRGYYRCETLVTAAEPGNAHHSRFYRWFHNPVSLQRLVLALQCATVVAQLLSVVRWGAWYQLVSGVLVLTANMVPLFWMVRDYLVSAAVYRTEWSALQRRSNQLEGAS